MKLPFDFLISQLLDMVIVRILLCIIQVLSYYDIMLLHPMLYILLEFKPHMFFIVVVYNYGYYSINLKLKTIAMQKFVLMLVWKGEYFTSSVL